MQGENQFQPSVYSYDGWLKNVFSREGRAENKEKRAKRRRSWGWEQGARRSEQRAASLRIKASGKKVLTPDSKGSSLWKVWYPWGRRKRRVGSGILGTAKGYRPPQMYMDSEWRGTIVGGIMALQAAEIEPWTSIPAKSLEVKMRQPKGADLALIYAVNKATGQKFKDLRKTSGYVRQAVIDNKLGGIAWPARKLSMLGAVALRQAASSAGSSAAGLTMQGIALGLDGTVVGLPAGVVVHIAGALVAGIGGAVAKIKGSKAKGEIAKAEQEFVYGVESRLGRKEAAAVQMETDKMAAKVRYQEQLAQKVGEAKGQQVAEYAKILGWAGGITVSLVAVSLIVKKVRGPK